MLFVGDAMKNVILEYISPVIGIIGTISFMGMLHYFFLGRDGLISTLILYAVGGI